MEEGDTEDTLLLELSRPLTDTEMKGFLVKNKQQAIGQMVDGKGTLYGNNQKEVDDNWGGGFAPQYFPTFNGDKLTAKVPPTKTIGKEGTEVKTSTKKVSEGLNKPAKMIKVGGKVLAEPVEGDIFQEGQRVIFEDKDGNQSDLGNIDEIGNKGFNEIKEFGIATEDTKVTSKGNTITVEGVEFKKDKSVSIKKNAAGEVTSVTLTPLKGGKKVTFRGDVATDIQYTVELGGAIPTKAKAPTVKKKAPEKSKTKEVKVNDSDISKKKKETTGSEAVDLQDPKAVVALAERQKDRKKRGIVRKAFRAAKALKSFLPDISITMHETQDSFNKAMKARGSNYMKGRNGNFSYTVDGKGKYIKGSGQIHINLSEATERVVAHEVAHAVLLAKFGDSNVALYNKFKKQIEGLIAKDTNADLQDFIDSYDKDGSSEEFIVELIATVANTKEKISLKTLQAIAEFINKLTSKLGAGVVFKNVRDTKEVIDFIESVANSLDTGSDVNLDTQGLTETSDGAILSGKISTGIKGRAIKNSIFVNNLELKRFDTHSNTKVVKNFDLRSIVGQLASSTLSDKLVAGILGKFKLYGGVGYPEATGLLWAASNRSSAQRLVDKFKRAKDGNLYLLPAIMSNVSHMSNKDMSVVAMEVLKEAAANKELDLNKLNGYISKLFKNKGLVKYNEGITKAMGGAKTTNKGLDILLDFMFSNELTFEERRNILQSLIGESAKGNPKFKTVGTFTQLAESLSEPLVKDSSIYEVNVAYRTKGDIRVVKLSESDPRYHKSYPYAIESTAKIEVLHLSEGYNLVDIFPEFTKVDGEKKSLAQEFADKRGKYTDKYIRTNFGRTHGLSSYSEPINVPQGNTGIKSKDSLAPDKRTKEEKKQDQARLDKYKEEMSWRFVDDGKGNYVFRHHSYSKRTELSPRSTHGNLIISKEEQRAINSVGGLTMVLYTRKPS